MSTPTGLQHHSVAPPTVVLDVEPSGLEQRLAQSSLRRVEAKEFVFAEGDPTTHIFQVETGAVALYKVLCDGRRQVVGFAYPGDLIGLGAAGEHVMNAQAIKPTRLQWLPRDGAQLDRAAGPAARLQALRGATRPGSIGGGEDQPMSRTKTTRKVRSTSSCSLRETYSPGRKA